MGWVECSHKAEEFLIPCFAFRFMLLWSSFFYLFDQSWPVSTLSNFVFFQGGGLSYCPGLSS